jgi:AraC family transcriptional regulator
MVRSRLIPHRSAAVDHTLHRGVAIAAVAIEFGFADQSHFTRVFKQVKGVTPKQFLALHR